MVRLCGVKEISKYVGYSETTIMRWIFLEGLPAGKIGGSWVSDSDQIDKWWRKKVASGAKRQRREVK